MSLVRNTEYHALSRAFGVKEFGKLLEGAMVRESKDSKKTSFAPSGLGYKGSCPRRWYYAFNGAYFDHTSTTPEALANMMAGSASGERLANMLDDAGILLEAEGTAELSDPPIFGYVDAVIEWNGKKIIVEVKTTSDEQWNRRVSKNSVPGYQLIQLLIYMYVRDCDHGIFITENKNTHELFVLPIKMTDEYRQLVENVFNWMREVKQAADNQQLPKRSFNKSSLQCKGCEVRNTCWDGWKRGSVNGSDPNPGVIEINTLELPK